METKKKKTWDEPLRKIMMETACGFCTEVAFELEIGDGYVWSLKCSVCGEVSAKGASLQEVCEKLEDENSKLAEKMANVKVPKKLLVVRQDWEESERGWGVRPDGCSLHVDPEEHEKYMKAQGARQKADYARTGSVPDEYERPSGKETPFMLTDPKHIRNLLLKGTIRLWRSETNRL